MFVLGYITLPTRQLQLLSTHALDRFLVFTSTYYMICRISETRWHNDDTYPITKLTMHKW